MGKSRSRRRRRKQGPAVPLPTREQAAARDNASETTPPAGPTQELRYFDDLARRFLRDPRNPVPYGILALLLIGAVAAFAQRPLGPYALCPQHAVGRAHVAASIVIGVPIGLGFMTLCTVALCFALPAARMPVVTGAARMVVARAGLGAVYGTLLMVTALTAFLGESLPCRVDLLQEIGDAATWGTLFGAGFGSLRLFTALYRAARQTPAASQRFWLGVTLWLGLSYGGFVAVLLTLALLHGDGWPA